MSEPPDGPEPLPAPRPRPAAVVPGQATPASRTLPAGPTCEICGTVMIERHCKILCPRCGYQRDCSDP